MRLAVNTSGRPVLPLLVPEPRDGGTPGNNFDLIRLAMALLVVWSHSFALYIGSEDREPLSLIFRGVYNAGNIGVMVFFIISGFLVTQSFLRSPSTLDFMRKRVRRIYPGYLVATTICAFVIIPQFATVYDASILQVPRTLAANLLLRNYFPPSDAFAANPYPNAVNGSLWSIPFEFWCYVGVAILGAAGQLLKRRALLGAALAILAGRVVLDLLGRKPGWGIIGDIFGWPYLWFVISPSFLMGMLVLQFKELLPRSPVILAGVVAVAVCACWLSPHIGHLVFAPALAYVTFYAAFSEQRPLRGLLARGDFSYGAYLYAFPIQQMLVSLLGTKLSFPVYVAVSMALSLLAGVVSWHAVEKWFVRRRAPEGGRARLAEAGRGGHV